MRQKLYIVLLLCSLSISCGASIAKDWWLTMPAVLTPYLSKENKQKMIELSESNVKFSVTNRLGEQSRMDTLTADYLAVSLSEVARLEMRLLPCDTDTIVCIVQTVFMPEKRSKVNFYDRNWVQKDIALPELPVPARPDTMAQDEYQRLLRAMSVRTVYMRLAANAATLTMSYEPHYVSVDEQRSLQKLIIPVTFAWRGNRFE